MKYLGDFATEAGKLFNLVINQVLADYQAKIGYFLAGKQKILLLKSRCLQLARYSTTASQSAALAISLDNMLSQQAALETAGMNIINIVNAVKTNAIVIDAMNGKLPEYYELGKWATLQELWSNINSAKDSMLSFLSQVENHLNAITNIENQVKALEASVGIKSGGLDLSALFTIKNVMIAGAVLFIATKGLGLARAIKRYKR